MRKFVDTVDETMPAHGDRSSRRQTVVDAALDMADRLVTVQYVALWPARTRRYGENPTKESPDEGKQ